MQRKLRDQEEEFQLQNETLMSELAQVMSVLLLELLTLKLISLLMN